MYRYAMIDPKTNKVKNVVIWDGITEWAPSKTHLMIRSEQANIGDSFDYKTDKFTSPPIEKQEG